LGTDNAGEGKCGKGKCGTKLQGVGGNAVSHVDFNGHWDLAKLWTMEQAIKFW